MTQKIRKDPLWEDWLSMMTLTGRGVWFDWTRSLITWGFEKWQACPTIDVWNCHDKIKFWWFSHSGLWNCFSTIKWCSFRIFFDLVLSKHENFTMNRAPDCWWQPMNFENAPAWILRDSQDALSSLLVFSYCLGFLLSSCVFQSERTSFRL